MKWKVDCVQQVSFEFYVDLNPKDFLYCADEIELLDEVEDILYDRIPFFDKVSQDYTTKLDFLECENIRERIVRNYDFIKEWQELKNQSKKENE